MGTATVDCIMPQDCGTVLCDGTAHCLSTVRDVGRPLMRDYGTIYRRDQCKQEGDPHEGLYL